MVKLTGFVLVFCTTTAYAESIPDRPHRLDSNWWFGADLQAGVMRVDDPTTWAAIGLGLELRRRVVAGLRVGVRGAVLRVEPGYDRERIGIMDERRGVALHAALGVDYLHPIYRGKSLLFAITPEIGVGTSWLHVDGARGDHASVFAGFRLELEVTPDSPGDGRAPAAFRGRTIGTHCSVQVVDAGGDRLGWQFVVGQIWGR